MSRWPLINMFVISIERTRLHIFLGVFKKIELYIKSTKGVNGKHLNKKKLQADKTLSAKRTSMKRGVIGCFLSHRRIWQIVDTKNYSHAVIFEDDARPLTNLRSIGTRISTIIRSLNKHAPNWDVLLLGRNPRKAKNGDRLTKYCVRSGAFWGLFAYVIRNKTVRILAKQKTVQEISLPVDVLLSRLGRKRVIQVFAADPPLFRYDATFKSMTFGIK